jgi:hypothetical protein
MPPRRSLPQEGWFFRRHSFFGAPVSLWELHETTSLGVLQLSPEGLTRKSL